MQRSKTASAGQEGSRTPPKFLVPPLRRMPSSSDEGEQAVPSAERRPSKALPPSVPRLPLSPLNHSTPPARRAFAAAQPSPSPLSALRSGRLSTPRQTTPRGTPRDTTPVLFTGAGTPRSAGTPGRPATKGPLTLTAFHATYGGGTKLREGGPGGWHAGGGGLSAC